MNGDRIRILIADDHPIFRDGLRGLLESVADTAVVGEATTGEEAVARAAALQPDVVLMDLKMPGLNGIEATRRIVGASPHVGVLVVTMYDDDDSVFAAMRAGARGYLLKDADQEDLLRAIQARPGEAEPQAPAAQPERPVSPVAQGPRFRRGGPTAREREVLALIAEGRNNAMIAARLSLSLKTVQNHVSNILSKLQVADRAQAIVRAREAGLGQ